MTALTTSDPEAVYLSRQLITCIGNKRALLPFIGEAVTRVRDSLGGRKLSVLDAFAGSGVVSRYLKSHASRLVSNDLELYATVAARCFLANRGDVDTVEIEHYRAEVMRRAKDQPVHDGIIRRNYAPKDDSNIQPGERVFYTVENARIIDTLRTHITDVPAHVQPFLLGPLLAMASVHANTAGVFKGFYKDRQTGVGRFGGKGEDALKRIKGRIQLPAPVFSRYSCRTDVRRMDANRLVRELDPVDLAYFDPPYNQHPYGSNYFMLNLIAEYTDPGNVSPVSGIPRDWNRSDYNSRVMAETALEDLVMHTQARFLLVSYNDEGLIAPDRVREILSRRGPVTTLEREYNTFRGSRNLKGRSKHVRELLYLVEAEA
jgi:adenine-specific DNA-methyltransferase